jgi:hypothetical protein
VAFLLLLLVKKKLPERTAEGSHGGSFGTNASWETIDE